MYTYRSMCRLLKKKDSLFLYSSYSDVTQDTRLLLVGEKLEKEDLGQHVHSTLGYSFHMFCFDIQN